MRVCWLALALACGSAAFVCPPALASTCSGAPRTTDDQQFAPSGAQTTVGIHYEPNGQFGAAEVQAAIALWTACGGAGTDFPGPLDNQDGTFDVTLTLANSSGSDACGSRSGSEITIYSFAIRNGQAFKCTDYTTIIAHELGHWYGLAHTPGTTCCDQYIMFPTTGGSDDPNRKVQSQECSQAKAEWIMPHEPEHPSNQDPIGSDPEPIPNPDCTEGHNCTPILIDVGGQGFRLTSVDQGVSFDLDADGERERLSWTDPWGDEAFLALDRNGNGTIDDGSELFGGVTAQSPSDEPNGFRALAVFDSPPEGGNDDGWLSAEDAIFPLLVLWHDGNQDGVSQPFELTPLTASDVEAIGLDPVISRRADRHGNLFRWASPVRFIARSGLSAMDVIFLSE